MYSLRVSLEWRLRRKDWCGRNHRFCGPPHHVINVYGAEGGGATSLGWLMEREGYATYGDWAVRSQPILPRLTLDNAATESSWQRVCLSVSSPVESRSGYLALQVAVL